MRGVEKTLVILKPIRTAAIIAFEEFSFVSLRSSKLKMMFGSQVIKVRIAFASNILKTYKQKLEIQAK